MFIRGGAYKWDILLGEGSSLMWRIVTWRGGVIFGEKMRTYFLNGPMSNNLINPTILGNDVCPVKNFHFEINNIWSTPGIGNKVRNETFSVRCTLISWAPLGTNGTRFSLKFWFCALIPTYVMHNSPAPSNAYSLLKACCTCDKPRSTVSFAAQLLFWRTSASQATSHCSLFSHAFV